MHHRMRRTACCILLLVALGIAQGLRHAGMHALRQGKPGRNLISALGKQQPRATRQPFRRAAAAVAERPAGEMARRSIAAPQSDRPAFHVMPRQGWINDPNGPLYFGGEYHM
jgi:hypothetical protein